MSTYFTVRAVLVYKDREAYDAARKLVEDWIHNGVWVSEYKGEEIETDFSDPETLTIDIPHGFYRNLARMFEQDKLFANTVAGSKAVWTSTDGMFNGGVITPGKEENYDLEDYAKKIENYSPKEDKNFDPDEDFDEYADWMSDVEMSFIDEHAPD